MSPEDQARLAAIEAREKELAEADNQKRLDAITAREATMAEDTVIPGLHVSRAAQTVGDLGNVGAQGLTLGYSDEIKAAVLSALSSDTYEQSLANEQAKLHDAKVRMNARTPGSGEVLEGLTSMVGPGAIAKKVSQVGSPLWRSAASVGTGAGVGGVSAEGHDRDPLAGMVTGAVGGMIQPLGSLAGSLAPKIGALTGAGAGGWLGSLFGNLPGQIGAVGGGAVGYGAGQAAKTAAQSPGGRDALAKIAMMPGALYDQGADTVEAARAKLRELWNQ